MSSQECIPCKIRWIVQQPSIRSFALKLGEGNLTPHTLQEWRPTLRAPLYLRVYQSSIARITSYPINTAAAESEGLQGSKLPVLEDLTGTREPTSPNHGYWIGWPLEPNFTAAAGGEMLSAEASFPEGSKYMRLFRSPAFGNPNSQQVIPSKCGPCHIASYAGRSGSRKPSLLRYTEHVEAPKYRRGLKWLDMDRGHMNPSLEPSTEASFGKHIEVPKFNAAN